MKISNLLSIVGFVALSGVVLAQDEADTVALKGYFNSQEGRLDDDHDSEFRNFVVTPSDTRISENTDYKLEFTVLKKTFQKMYYGYLVFLFPGDFGLTNLDSANIEITNYDGVGFLVREVSISGNFVLVYYRTVFIDGSGNGSLIPDSMNLEIFLHVIKNSRKTGNYKVAGAGIKDHRIVAGPTWSKNFEITEESQETKAELQIVSTELVAPNSPKVNTNQEVAIEVLVANVGNKTAHNVSVGLESDGESSINTPQTIEMLEPNDTALVSFEVTVGSEFGPEWIYELFSSEILSGNVFEVDAVDDSATAIIQSPANLVLNSSIEDRDTLFLSTGENYNFTFSIFNYGQSRAGVGKYQLDGPTGQISTIDATGTSSITRRYVAPLIDTILNHSLVITETPPDLNTLLPAIINDTEIIFTVIVDAEGGEDLESNFIVENNPFNPNDGPVRFVYNLNEPSNVNFKIFTVTGEVVHTDKFIFGSQGGKAGTNQIQWDGRNDSGETVLNGVYIAVIEVVNTGQKASLKLAVLK